MVRRIDDALARPLNLGGRQRLTLLRIRASMVTRARSTGSVRASLPANIQREFRGQLPTLPRNTANRNAGRIGPTCDERHHQSGGPSASQNHHRPRDLVNSVAANIPATKKLPRLHWPIMWTIVVTGLIVWGMHARLERYITPQRGTGYWLGITGGSLMLLLLMYRRVSASRGWVGWEASPPGSNSTWCSESSAPADPVSFQLQLRRNQ